MCRTRGSVRLASSNVNRFGEREGVTGLGVSEEEPAMSQPPFYATQPLVLLAIMIRLGNLSIGTSPKKINFPPNVQ